MRIEFFQSSRPPFPWSQALLRVGSDPDNDLTLAPHQAAPHHLRISLDRRGWVLEVLPNTHRIYVNARPVRERAILRAGDVLSIGDCRMLLCADDVSGERVLPDTPEQERCTVALRAVAGPLSGRVFPLTDRLELGSQGQVPLDLPQGEVASLIVFWRNNQLRMEIHQAMDSRYPARVNGRLAHQAALFPGDQIGIGAHRFLVDAPGLEPEPELALPPSPVHALPEEAAGPRGEVWWLIATAAVLALGIALLLFLRF